MGLFVTNDTNKLDWLPVISTVFSGPVRIIDGVVELVAHTIFFTLSLPLGWVSGKWKYSISSHHDKMRNGLLNIIRGIIACVPIVGNLVLHSYDTAPMRKEQEKAFANSLLFLSKNKPCFAHS